MSKEHPILCCDSVVRAIRDGRQTQDRRPIKKPDGDYYSVCHGLKTSLGYTASEHHIWAGFGNPDDPVYFKYPFGEVGDILWVRECFSEIPIQGEIMGYAYRADGENAFDNILEGWNFMGKWTPSIHMPRKACRTLLEVLDVRAERVQDISEEDAIAEGCICRSWESAKHDNRWNADKYAANVFSGLWDSLYAAKGYGWDANPFVWATTFRIKETT